MVLEKLLLRSAACCIFCCLFNKLPDLIAAFSASCLFLLYMKMQHVNQV